MKTRKITDVMTKNVVCIGPNQKLLDVKHIYEKKQFHHHIPVIENEELVGMVSLIDFMYHISGAGLSDEHDVYEKILVKDIMTKNPFYLTTDDTLEKVSKVLIKGNYHAVPILENSKVVGIVSTADVIKFLLEAV